MFQGLLEAAPDAILGVDATGRIAIVNAQAERLFGYTRDELIGESVDILVPEGARAIHPDRRAEYVNDPQPRPMGAGMDLAGLRKDGVQFPAEISLSAIDTTDGRLVLAAVRDVSEQRRASEARSRLASMVQSSHDAIMGKTLDGIITDWNPAAEKLYGYPADEIIGRSIFLLIPAERNEEERALFEKVARGEQIEQYETERVCADGTRIAVSVTMSPITEPNGTIIGLSSVSRDRSSRQRSEAMFRGLLEAAPDAIVGVDRAGTIALVNGQAERLFGYTREELLGKPVEVLVPESARAVHPQHRTMYFADPRQRPMGAGMELAARRRDGTEFPAEISLSAIETEAGPLVSAAIRDVTDRIEARMEHERLRAQADRERLESQLHQSQRLESLGQLAGGVAHDFNNLLAVIMNYASFVAEEIDKAAQRDGDSWRQVQRDVEQIERAAERASRLTHQLLMFGRREVIRPEVLDLNRVVADVEALLQRSIGEDVELVTSLDPDLWPIAIDPGQIEQVLVNLAVNARDAMPRGGTLTIDTENLVVDEDLAVQTPNLVPGRHVRLRVRDTGPGMPPEVLARVFEPFFTTKPKGEGSGLGLATVYGIVTQAGGTAEFVSEPELGTTFTALLPASDERLTSVERDGSTHRFGGGETVLVVEDENAMRDVTGRILARNGHEVLTAGSGVEALALVEEYGGVIDLLITDVVMPGMLGKEIAERIRQLRPGIRVLYISGYAQPVLASRGTLDEGVTLLEKPFSEPALLLKVREVLDADA
jgi:PAS domain S-box-containing protein